MSILDTQLSFRFDLSQIPEAKSEEEFKTLLPIYNALQNLAYQLDAYVGRYREQADNYPLLGTANINSIQQNKFYCQANAAILPGELIYFLNDAGTIKADLAQADSIVTRCRGIYLGEIALAGGDWGEFILSPTLLTTSSLIPGENYYLSTSVAGGYQATRPSVATEIIQSIGFALSDTMLFVYPSPEVILL